MQYEPLDRIHVEGVVSPCRGRGWPSYARDAELTYRALRLYPEAGDTA